MSPSLAVIIINFNYGRYLGAAVDSLLRQTVPVSEIIVVDDGSTDNSREVIANYGEFIRPVLQANGGQRSAYNSGFSASTADLVLFLDSDDFLDETAVSGILAAWREGTAKLHFYLRVVSATGEDSGSYVPSGELAAGDVRPLLLTEGAYISPPASGNVYPRWVLKQLLPMDVSLRYGADLPVVHMAPFFGDVVAIRKPLGGYRIHGANHDVAAVADAPSIRAALQAEQERTHLLREAAAVRGLKFDQASIESQPHHLKLHLAALRMGIESGSETRFRLAFRGVAAAMRNRNGRVAKRILFSAWFIAMAAAPAKYIPYLAKIGLSPAGRPQFAVRAAAPKDI